MITANSAVDSDHWAAFESIVNRRISCRGFLPEPVPQPVLEAVFTTAQRAPSNCNTQPWQVAVANGSACKTLRQAVRSQFAMGKFEMDFPYDGVYEGVYKERQYGSALALYSAQDIKRDDKKKREESFMRNFDFFDAPHVAFLFLPQPFGIREAADLGMYAQNLMLSMSAAGLGSCPQTALSFVAGTVRRELGIDERNRLLFGISFGYPDWNHPANRCRTDRVELQDAVKFVD